MVHIDASRNYYADLELPPDCSTDDVKRQYRKLALLYHPDRNPGHEDESAPRFQAIGAAHEVLADPELRRKYDVSRQRGNVNSANFPRPAPPRRNPFPTSNFDPPPRRGDPRYTNRQPPPRDPQPSRDPPPQANGGAARYQRFSNPTPPPVNTSSKHDAQARANNFKAWQSMQNQRSHYAQRDKPGYNVPPPYFKAGTSPTDEADMDRPRPTSDSNATRSAWDEMRRPHGPSYKPASSRPPPTPQRSGEPAAYERDDDFNNTRPRPMSGPTSPKRTGDDARRPRPFTSRTSSTRLPPRRPGFNVENDQDESQAPGGATAYGPPRMHSGFPPKPPPRAQSVSPRASTEGVKFADDNEAETRGSQPNEPDASDKLRGNESVRSNGSNGSAMDVDPPHPSSPDADSAPRFPPRRSSAPGLSFNSFRHVEPFSTEPKTAGGIDDMHDLSDTLPFPSQASPTHPSKHEIEEEINRGGLPRPPKPPLQPSNLTQPAWNYYLQQMTAYVSAWNTFNARMVAHFQDRAVQNQDREKGPAGGMVEGWLGAVGETEQLGGWETYVASMKEDERIRVHWNIACERHYETIEKHGKLRDQVLRGGLVN